MIQVDRPDEFPEWCADDIMLSSWPCTRVPSTFGDSSFVGPGFCSGHVFKKLLCNC